MVLKNHLGNRWLRWYFCQGIGLLMTGVCYCICYMWTSVVMQQYHFSWLVNLSFPTEHHLIWWTGPVNVQLQQLGQVSETRRKRVLYRSQQTHSITFMNIRFWNWCWWQAWWYKIHISSLALILCKKFFPLHMLMFRFLSSPVSLWGINFLPPLSFSFHAIEVILLGKWL